MFVGNVGGLLKLNNAMEYEGALAISSNNQEKLSSSYKFSKYAMIKYFKLSFLVLSCLTSK